MGFFSSFVAPITNTRFLTLTSDTQRRNTLVISMHLGEGCMLRVAPDGTPVCQSLAGKSQPLVRKSQPLASMRGRDFPASQPLSVTPGVILGVTLGVSKNRVSI